MIKRIAILMIVLTAFLYIASLGETLPGDIQPAMERMLEGNARYIGSELEIVYQDRRTDTAENGQYPYAVVVTCSDSRVPVELIFDAGIGELFVIRTAGNVIGDYELGCVEYGAEHLHVPLVIVMGHTHCGAVDAALNGGAHGYIQTITDEISSCLPENCSLAQAEKLNVQNSIARIRGSEIIRELEANGETAILGAIYDIETGMGEIPVRRVRSGRIL